MNIDIFEADLNDPKQADAFLFLLNRYALDPMGGAQPLSACALNNLISAVQQRPTIRVILAVVDDVPAGLINTMEGFSTFACQPLLNLHDVMVDKPFRGLGLARKMLTKAEALAHSLGCCKLTLEVLDNNQIAKTAYTKFGFENYQLVPEKGHAIYLEKKLL
ncbi:MAG: GNAT family N-acetyltransferase [Cocleimonas sp.]|nr:GNAT family N-acetyltransferase [Cocleimonas sp.]